MRLDNCFRIAFAATFVAVTPPMGSATNVATEVKATVKLVKE